MKKIKSILLCMSVFSLICVPSFASTSSNSSKYMDPNIGSLQDQLQNERNIEKRKKEIENIVVPHASTTASRTINVPTYKQETGYWCGPANVKQVIQFINGSSASQSTYASSMGTTGNGTDVYKVTNELNKRQSKFTYAHIQIGSNDKQSLATSIFIDIDRNKPCIFNVATKYLYLYNGVNLQHYITCRGYNFSGFQTASLGTEISTYANQPLDGTVYYTDPYSNNYGRGNLLGNHSDSLNNIFNAQKGKYFIY